MTEPSTTHAIEVTINGKIYHREVEARQLLVHFIRDTLDLTGTHIGCDTGSCGACSVILNGKLVKSCMLLAPQADGAVIDTVEGLAADGDVVVDKCRYDAFLHTSLEVVLHGLGVTELVVCGVVTNVCVESTVRSAYMRDFAVTLLGDCCAGRTQRLHEISLEALAASEFAQVAELERGFRFSCAPPAAPAAGLGRPREER